MSDIPSDIMERAGDAILEGGKAYMVGEEFHIAIAKDIYENARDAPTSALLNGNGEAMLKMLRIALKTE